MNQALKVRAEGSCQCPPDLRQKRSADVVGNAVRVMKIATGEIDEDTPIGDGKDPAAKALGAPR